MASFNRASHTKGFHRSHVKFYLILFPVVIFMILPIIYIVSTAFKPIDELFLFPPRFFASKPTFSNFRNLLSIRNDSVPLSRYLFNSLVVTLSVTVLSVIISSMAGFALSKMKFAGKKFWFELNQLALMFVAASIAIPKYLVIERLGLIDTIYAHIFPIMAIPVGLFLVKQFIDQIPDSLLEAARIDGANDFLVFFRIVIPIITPALATVGILAFQQVWNNIETSKLYINQENLRTLAFYMNTFTDTSGNHVAGQGLTAAASLIMFLPNLIIFIFLQSKIMNTVAHSGIK